MNPLDRNNRNIFSLLQKDKIYLFNTANLVNIICSSLSNAPHFFVEPLVLKNPYNNVPFNKSDLYNMYFFLKQSPIIMPVLFHNYFLADFDLRRFRDENENIIKDIAFKSSIRNGTSTSLYVNIIKMLKTYKPQIIIHSDFPKDTLVSIMQPYLFLYYTIQYSAEEYRIIDAQRHLKYKLNKLYKYNPAFGRKIIRLKRVGFSKKMKKYIEFNDKHPIFDEHIDMKTYQKIHLELIETKYINENYDYYDYNNDNDSEEEEVLHYYTVAMVSNPIVPNNIINSHIFGQAEAEAEEEEAEAEDED
jgi:hypothetical protein